jgi:hypothetical protein
MRLEVNNPQAQWSRKPDKHAPGGSEQAQEQEELQLSPVKPRNNANQASVSWSKSRDEGRRSLSGNPRGAAAGEEGQEEELVLEPKGVREGQVVQSVSWQRQSSGKQAVYS